MKPFAQLIFAITIACGLLVSGCAKDPEKAVLGTWTLTGASKLLTPAVDTPGDTPTVQAPSSIAITLKDDKTFSGGGMEGTWSVADQKLTLKFTKIMDKSVEDWQQSLEEKSSSIESVSRAVGARNLPGSGNEVEGQVNTALSNLKAPAVFDMSSDYSSAVPDIEYGLFSSAGGNGGAVKFTRS